MKNWRLWVLYGLLVWLAVFVALRTRSRSTVSELPSLANPAAGGLKALSDYLNERGAESKLWASPLSELPSDVRVLVMAAPNPRPVSKEERQQLERFVAAGNTLVYLAPDNAKLGQAELQDWWSLEAGDTRAPNQEQAPSRVVNAHGPLVGIQTLHLSELRGLQVIAPSALPVAVDGDQVTGWLLPWVKGEIYLFSGTELAENRWLETEQNLDFWEQLSLRGPVYFDELHFTAAPPPPASPALKWTLLQLAGLILVVYWARGIRLGPARPLVLEKHRSTREYLSSFGWLLRRAGVERELAESLHRRLRRQLWERANIPVHVSDEEASLQWAQRTGQPAERLRRWSADIAEPGKLSPAEFARLTREATAIESVGSLAP